MENPDMYVIFKQNDILLRWAEEISIVYLFHNKKM